MTNRLGNHSCRRIFVSTVKILLIFIACFIGSETSNASPSESRSSHHVTVKKAVSGGLLIDNNHNDGDVAVASKTRIINQRAVLQVHVVINGTRGTNQWSVVLDEVTNQASTIHSTQDVHIDWSSPGVSPPHGVADLSFEVPAHPVISRTFLLSLFEKDTSSKLVTRRFATVHATQTPGSSRLVPVLLQGATSSSSTLSTLSHFTTTSNTFLAGLICLGLYYLLASPSRVRRQTTLQDHDEDDESWIHEDDDESAEEEDSGYDASVSHEGNPDHDFALDGPSDESDEFLPPTIQRHAVDPSIFEELEQLGISLPQPSTIATPEYRTPPPNEIPPRHSVFPASPPTPEPLPPACSRQPRTAVTAVDSTNQSCEEEETASMLTAAASNIGEVDAPATHAGDNTSDVSATNATKTLPEEETKQVASQSPLTGITNEEQLVNSIQEETNQRNPVSDRQTIGQAIEAEHCETHRVPPETVVDDPECDRRTAEHDAIDEARNEDLVQEGLEPSKAADDRQTVGQEIEAEQGEAHHLDAVAHRGVDCIDPAESDTTDKGRKKDSVREEKKPADERQTVGQAIGAEQSEARRSMPIQDMDVGCHIATTEDGSNDGPGDAAHQTRESQGSREAKATATQARQDLRDSDFGVEDEGDKENHETNNSNSAPPAACAPQCQVPQQTRDFSVLQQNTRALPRNLESESRQALHEGEAKADISAPIRQPRSPALDRAFASPLPSNREAARIDKSDPNWLQRLSHPKQIAAPAHADVEATSFRTGGTRMTRSKTSEARATVSEQSTTGASAPSSSVFQLPTPIPPAGKVKETKRVTPKDKNWLQRLRSKPERVTRPSSGAPAPPREDINVEDSSYVSTLPSDSETSSVAPDDPFEFLNEGENHEASEVRIKPATTPSRKRKRGFGNARATRSFVAHNTVAAVSTGSSTSTGPADDDNAVIMWEPTEKEKAVLPRRKKRRSQGVKVVPDSVPSLESVAAKVTAPVWQFNAQEIASVKKDATGNQKRKAKGHRSAKKNRQRGVPDSIKLRRPSRTKKAKGA